MIKLMSLGAASVAAVGVCLTANWALQPGVGAQVPPAAAQAASRSASRKPWLTADFPFMNDKERMKDWLEATIGNMRPLIKDERGVRFQSREAIRYKDGTAKLWSQEKKDPVAPTLRHKGPIRELTFFDESNLLVTRSDESIKLWDGLTGEPRKELDGQTIQPDVALVRPRGQAIRDYRLRSQGRDRLGRFHAARPSPRFARRIPIASSRRVYPGTARRS